MKPIYHAWLALSATSIFLLLMEALFFHNVPLRLHSLHRTPLCLHLCPLPYSTLIFNSFQSLLPQGVFLDIFSLIPHPPILNFDAIGVPWICLCTGTFGRNANVCNIFFTSFKTSFHPLGAMSSLLRAHALASTARLVIICSALLICYLCCLSKQIMSSWKPGSASRVAKILPYTY